MTPPEAWADGFKYGMAVGASAVWFIASVVLFVVKIVRTQNAK